MAPMTNQALIPDDIAARYEVHEWRNGLAILTAARPDEWREILEVLRDFPRLDGGSGGVCPVVVFGIKGAAYVED
jgi:hypothetical protein